MKPRFQLTTVRISRDLRKRIRDLSRDHEISEGTVIRQMLNIGERHFSEEAFRAVRAGKRVLLESSEN
jgi:hypothetical protein